METIATTADVGKGFVEVKVNRGVPEHLRQMAAGIEDDAERAGRAGDDGGDDSDSDHDGDDGSHDDGAVATAAAPRENVPTFRYRHASPGRKVRKPQKMWPAGTEFGGHERGECVVG